MNPALIDIIVMGGGAAGFFAAINCAETYPKARVTILEKGAHVLTKVRISGGGRCNVTHACYDPKRLVQYYPRGGKALLGPFHSFQPRDTVAWFETRGIPLKTEDDGRIFPTTDTSITIINALKDAAQEAGVKVKTQSPAISVTSTKPRRFSIRLKSGDILECDRLLLATGNAPDGYTIASFFGHSIESPVPSLFTFAVPDERLRDMAGVAVAEARVRLVGTPFEQTGPVLITHWGLSGPAILKLSSWGARALAEQNYHAPIEINWTGKSPADVAAQLFKFKTSESKKLVSAHPQFLIPRRLWERLVKNIGLPESCRWADVSKPQLNKLTQMLTANTYIIRGKSTFKEEFVTCGGVHLDEVNFKSMESRQHPGLYFAGEILDVDALTGGFNFQNAWTTGWLAGQAMGKP